MAIIKQLCSIWNIVPHPPPPCPKLWVWVRHVHVKGDPNNNLMHVIFVLILIPPLPPISKVGMWPCVSWKPYHNFGYGGSGGAMLQLEKSCLIVATNRGVEHDVASQVQS